MRNFGRNARALAAACLGVLIALGTLASPSFAAEAGYPLHIANQTGKWQDSQVWVFIMGQQTPGEWSYLDAAGAAHRINHNDANNSDALVKDGVRYPRMAFQLPADGNIQMPSNWQGGRAYISLGAPLYVSVSPDDKGLAIPDAANPGDPNYGTFWDFYELTFVNGKVAFGGDITQVDQFGFPMTAHVEQAESGFDKWNGLLKSRDQIVAGLKALPGGYSDLVLPTRVLAPRTAPAAWATSGASQSMAKYVDHVWQHYADSDLAYVRDGHNYLGRVGADGKLHFTVDGAGDYSVAKPSVTDVWQCSNSLATGDVTELGFEADMCAALYRGVAEDTTKWNTPSAYYGANQQGSAYAAYLHSIARENLTYAFAYDDSNHQSGVLILPNFNPPTRVTLTLDKWSGTVGPTIDRLAGSDRFDTAARASQAAYPNGAAEAVVVSGNSFADALSAGPVAAKSNAPLLLTSAGALPAATAQELTRLKVSKVLLVGGPAAVSNAVASTISSMGISVSRVSGQDRFETSRKVAEQEFSSGAPAAMIATGLNFPDALSGAAAIGAGGSSVQGPVVLVNGNLPNLDVQTQATLAGLHPTNLYISGGDVAVTAGIQNAMNAIATTTRFAGADRFQTSALINAHFFPNPQQAVFATGLNFPDALAGSAYAPTLQTTGSPLYTVRTDCVPASVLAQLGQVSRVTLLGGESTLKPEVAALSACK